MTVLWEFHQDNYVWLEWLENGATKLKRFTLEAYETFMNGVTLNAVVEDKEVEDLDFLN
tara:strand:+ start:12177 stop:12353 length:177 start_codon:yes stop_codon:yes gene_type:complete